MYFMYTAAAETLLQGRRIACCIFIVTLEQIESVCRRISLDFNI